MQTEWLLSRCLTFTGGGETFFFVQQEVQHGAANVGRMGGVFRKFMASSSNPVRNAGHR